MKLLDDKEVGKRLRGLRGESKPRQIALGANIDTSQYNKIENGTLPITKNILDKLVTTYGWNKDYILYGTNVPRETIQIEDGNTFQRLIKMLEQNIETISSQQKTIHLLAGRERPPGSNSISKEL